MPSLPLLFMADSSASKSLWRNVMALSLLLVLGSALLPLLIFGLTPYAAVEALGTITYAGADGHQLRLALTPERYAGLRGGLFGTALVVSGALGLLARRTHWRAEWRQFGREIGPIGARLRATWHRLSLLERRVAAGLWLALLLARLWQLTANPLGPDEVASFDYFVGEGPRAIASFYPFPNNHPLFSLACWPLTALTDSVPLAMRLPSLLAATVSTTITGLLLTRRVGFVAATLGTALFSFAPLGLYYAAAGRGYVVQLTLVQAAFFAVLALLRHSGPVRVAWAVLGVAAVAGLYTIPTFVYPLVALAAGLLGSFARAGRWADVGRLALLGAAVAASTGLLYAPVVVVSGWEQLIGNRYVAPLPVAEFWGWFAGHLHTQADLLAGGPWLGVAGAIGLALVGPWLWRTQPAQRPVWALTGLLLVVPVVLLAGQQVLPPARVLLFMAYFGSLLLGAGGAAVLTRWRVARSWQVLAAVVLIGGWAAYHGLREAAALRAAQQRAGLVRAAYRWLTAHGVRRVWVASARHELFWHHFALLEKRPLQLVTPEARPPRADYVVAVPATASAPPWVVPPHYQARYRDALVVIYGRLPPPAP